MKVYSLALILSMPLILVGYAQQLSTPNPQLPPSIISWEKNPLLVESKEFGERQKVVFAGTNNTSQRLVITAIRPDCTACINLSASSDVVEPGQSVTISGDVILKTDGRQAGRIAVAYEAIQTPDILAYQVVYPIPFQLSSRSFVWLDGRESQSLTVKLNSLVGISYDSFKVDEELFQVVVKEQTPDAVVLDIKPLSNGRVRDALYINLKYTDPQNPQNVRIVDDKAFVTLALEENAKP